MSRPGDRPLVVWSWVVLALLAAHDLTHLLDDGLDTSPGQLALVAVPQWIALAIVMAVLVRDPGRRRLAATLLGAAVAAGFAIIHLLPSSLAAYSELQPSAVSWVLAWVPAAAGLALVVIAQLSPRRAGAAAPAPPAGASSAGSAPGGRAPRAARRR